MHAAPPVTYPVARSPRAALLVLLASGAGLAALAAWLVQSDSPGWRQGLAGAVWLVATAWATIAWALSPRGSIAWSGTDWCWTPAGAPRGRAGELALALDFQSFFLARWEPPGGGGVWLWLERQGDPARWNALRRAVYSRARIAAPQGATRPPVSNP